MARKCAAFALSLVIYYVTLINSCTNCSNAEEVYDTDKFVSSLITHLNKLPSQSYTYKDGKLLSAQAKSPYTYKIEAKLEALCNDQDKCQSTLIKCDGLLEMDSDTGEIYIIDNDLNCSDDEDIQSPPQTDVNPQKKEQNNISYTNVPQPIIEGRTQLLKKNPLPVDYSESVPIYEEPNYVIKTVNIEMNSPFEVTPMPIEHADSQKPTNPSNENVYIIDDGETALQLPSEPHYKSKDDTAGRSTLQVNEPKSSEEVDSHTIQLKHEVQPVDKVTSGEQFVAVRRVNNGGCSDCASDVDVNATGVDKLVSLALHHLDRHDMQHKHELNTVVRIQRQVQIVNGVRYILLVDVNFLNIPDKNRLNIETKRCKVSFLEKPWLKLSDGSKFRAIISNNCTEQYLYGDSGEIISNIDDQPKNGHKKDLLNELDINYPDSPPQRDQATVGENFDHKIPNYDFIANSGKADDILKLVQTQDLQKAKPNEMTIDAARLEDLVSQIIPEEPKPTFRKFEETPKDHFNKQFDVPETTKDWMVVYDVLKYHTNDEGMFKVADIKKTNEESSTTLTQDKKEALEGFIKLLGGFERLRPADLGNSKLGIFFNVQSDSRKPHTIIKDFNSIPDISVSNVRENDKSQSGRVDFIDTSSSIEDDTVVSYVRRKKRSLFDLTPKKDGFIFSLASLAVKTLDKYDEDNKKRVVLELLSIQKEKTNNGAIYKMHLKVGHTNCLENEYISQSCFSDDELDQVKLCKVKVFASSTGTQKVLYYHCQDEKNRPMLVRHSRQVSTGGGITNLGRARQVDLNDTNVISLTKESLQFLDRTNVLTNRRAVVEIVSATRQLVSGLLYNIEFKTSLTDCPSNDLSKHLSNCNLLINPYEICNARIYYQPWVKDTPKNINVTCHRLSQNSPTVKREKRQANVNAPVKIKITDGKIILLTLEAIQSMDSTNNSNNALKVVKIMSATSQLESPDNLLYKIIFEVTGYINTTATTDCIYQCNLKNAYSEICSALIYNQTSLNGQKNITVDCNDVLMPKSHRRDIFKGNDYLFNEAITKIESIYVNSNKQKIDQILYATKPYSKNAQAKFTVGVTNCSNRVSDDIGCIINPIFGPSKTCTLERVMWERFGDIVISSHLNVKCEESPSVDSLKNTYDIVKARRLFFDFISKHQKSYINDSVEFPIRFKVFRQNLKIIRNLNFFEQGTATYGISRFADLTYEEFRSKYMGLSVGLRNDNEVPIPMADIPDLKDIPDAFDWRDKGAVTPIKDQGQCGSCWAFSVTGNIEGQWKLKNGTLLSLSEQELVDCDTLDEGCNGGLPDNAYRAIEKLGGLEQESDYPYDAHDEKCNFNKTLSRVQISGAVNISSNETDMQKWLYKNGPISIGINANAMQFYMGGVSHPWQMLCNPTSLDHGVLIVGYGIDKFSVFKRNVPFWIIKNSWGPSWGEQGYYRVFRGDGTCGVNKMASSAIVT